MTQNGENNLNSRQTLAGLRAHPQTKRRRRDVSYGANDPGRPLSLCGIDCSSTSRTSLSNGRRRGRRPPPSRRRPRSWSVEAEANARSRRRRCCPHLQARVQPGFRSQSLAISVHPSDRMAGGAVGAASACRLNAAPSLPNKIASRTEPRGA